MSVCEHIMYIQVPSEAEEATGCPGPGAMNSCELSGGAGNGTQVGPLHTQQVLLTAEPRSSPCLYLSPMLRKHSTTELQPIPQRWTSKGEV